MLDMLRNGARMTFNDVKFGSRADDLVLCCAIFVGEAEGKPMTAAKLADYAGIPRPTVARKLREMIGTGVITLSAGGQVRVDQRVDLSAVAESIVRGVHLVRRAAADLSKMDIDAIAAIHGQTISNDDRK